MKARILVSLAAMGFTGLALAQQGASPSFSDVDKNSDGQISRSEAQSVEGLDFSKADTNQDGHLDRTEYDAATKSKSQ
ncbi:MAG TPA: EF-hand domain-containing protein [Gammaproteobacteria bacterium]|nr:EF-hand domain-containing protein [Gammaproteobacteria bacterium]